MKKDVFVSFSAFVQKLVKVYSCVVMVKKKTILLQRINFIIKIFLRINNFFPFLEWAKSLYNGNHPKNNFGLKVAMQGSKWQINLGGTCLIDQNVFSCYRKQKQNSILEKVGEKIFLLKYYQFVKKIA